MQRSRIAAPRPSATDARHEHIIDLYEAGATLEQIGRSLNLTRERARQLVDELTSQGKVVKRPRAERLYRATFPARGGEVEALFVQLRDDAAVAQITGIETALVRRFVDERVPDAHVLRRKRKTRCERYSDDELVRCLRVAARELASPMGHDAYAQWSRGRMLDQTRPWPGPQGITLRFGCWTTTLARAGLPAHPPAGRDASFELADALDAIVRAWREIGRPPTVADYDRWRAGREQYPAAATARKLVDGWESLQLAAWPVVHGRALPDVNKP